MRPRWLYQPFEHGTEELLNKHLLLIVVETGQLSPEGLAEEVCFHPGTFHQDLLVVEYLRAQQAPHQLGVSGEMYNSLQQHVTILIRIFKYIFSHLNVSYVHVC